MPDAARVDDLHLCFKLDPGPSPHVGGPITQGASHVTIAYSPAARKGDPCPCTGACSPASGADEISEGEEKVKIEKKPAARIGHRTKHGGVVVLGAPNVSIGSNAHGGPIMSVKHFGALCAPDDRPEEV